MLNALNHPKWSKVLAFPEPLQVLSQHSITSIRYGWTQGERNIFSGCEPAKPGLLRVFQRPWWRRQGANNPITRELRMKREWGLHWDRSLPFGAHSEAGKGAPLPAIASLPVFGLHIFIRLVYIFLRWRKLLDKEFQVVLEAMCCWGLGSCMLRGKRPALSGAAPGLRSQPFPHFWVQKKQFFIMKRSTS